MAPTAFAHNTSPTTISHITRSLSYLISRSTDPNTVPPLASIFALIVRQSVGVTPRSLSPSALPTHLQMNTRSLPSNADADAYTTIFHPSAALTKRQTYILAIPTTYQGLNAGPPPGTVAGVVLGSIAGFILVLYIVLSLLKLYTGRTFVETRIVERHRRTNNHSHSRSRSRARSRSVSEVPVRVRRERTVVEERVERSQSRGPTEVVVEEEHDDIVEVFEEHSEEGARRNRPSKRASGYRTVDPAELGGGSRPMRKVGRR